MIPIDFEINHLKVKVTVAFKLMIYGQNIVHIITTHSWLHIWGCWSSYIFYQKNF